MLNFKFLNKLIWLLKFNIFIQKLSIREKKIVSFLDISWYVLRVRFVEGIDAFHIMHLCTRRFQTHLFLQIKIKNQWRQWIYIFQVNVTKWVNKQLSDRGFNVFMLHKLKNLPFVLKWMRFWWIFAVFFNDSVFQRFSCFGVECLIL